MRSHGSLDIPRFSLIRQQASLSYFFCEALQFGLAEVKITVQKEIPLRDNSDGSDADKKDPAVLVVKGVGFATKHYRELVPPEW